ncbi:laminin subunit alpha-like [Tropilaelaps mercedesae]|uniref:Laminin subunit alpha-like n=1 Tax=Tropilaelaps mercedesae TaxID=418985 RepID=A0A1V9XJ85_9ACAR|nr:laminin subunit alpha-like [Tropilaelaps mercedesae]
MSKHKAGDPINAIRRRAAMGSASRGEKTRSLPARETFAVALFCVVLAAGVRCSDAQLNGSALSPNLLNLAGGRNIWASATCGDGYEKEEYCILGETNVGQKYIAGQMQQGQLCDFCDMRDTRKSHPARYAIENNHKYWQSPPLSRSAEYNAVNLTIDLGQDFHVAYVFIIMGISPRPGVWALERSVDHGKTYSPWQYFASDDNECQYYFGKDVEFTITRDDSVICETKYSSILPFQNGEIHVPILTGRPSQENFSSSEALQEWSRATNIRLRLMRTKTLLADVLSVNQKDPTVTRRYFYAIRHIDVGGRCVCNGHASQCSPTYDGKLLCSCEHQTDGDQCERCKDLYNQRAWQPASIDNRNECEKCNCHEHAHSCVYNATVELLKLSIDSQGQMRGGGVCKDCLHHTAGVNCERCKPGYYREEGKELTDVDVCTKCPCDFTGDNRKRFSGECEDLTARCKCDKKYREPDCDDCADGFYNYPNCKACDCFRNGTEGGLCHNNGQPCPCKRNFGGEFCKECASGFFNHPVCQSCECNPQHSLRPNVCDAESGKCQCSNGFGGRQCDRCDIGHFAYPECRSCECHPNGVTEHVCNKNTGMCLCKPGFTGDACEKCEDGFFGPDCQPCNCHVDGSVKNACSDKGRCKCRLGWTGDKCDRCAAGYYAKQDNRTCAPCACDRYGADGESCDAEGRCSCKVNFQSGDKFKCNQCAPRYYTYPFCEACNCNPMGTSLEHRGCQIGGDTLCVCKNRVGGRRCDTCKALFYNLRDTSEGCESCFCDMSGTHSAIMACEPKKGQCPCKANRDGRACSQCVSGTFKRNEDNIFGCEDCECNPSGSQKEDCDGRDGCLCRTYIAGEKCDQPTKQSYVPTLHQFQYEVETHRTPKRNEVRQGSNETEFPNFSGLGYAVFNELQPAIVIDVDIKKNSMHQVVLRYTNPGDVAQEMLFTLTPGSDDVPSEEYKAKLPPAKEPALIRLPAFQAFEGNLMPGPWTIQMKSMNVNVDYLVTLPQEYLSAAALKEDIKRPCKLGEVRPCKKMAYPPLERAVETFVGIQDAGGVELPKEIDGVLHKTAVLNPARPLDLQLNGFEPSSVFLVEYSSKKRDPDEFRKDAAARANVILELGGNSYKNQITLPYCRYTFLCRQAVIDMEGRVFESPDLWGERSQPRIRLSLPNAPADEEVYVHRIAAVPRNLYKHHLLNVSTVCIRDEESCHGLKYNNLGKKIHFAQSGDVIPIDPRIEDKNLRLVELTPAKQLVIIDGEAAADDGSFGAPSTILIHYYQPDFGDFEADVRIENEGATRNGKVLFAHCPSSSGCRTRVYVDKPHEPMQIHLSGPYSIEVKLPVRHEDEDMLLAKHLEKAFDEASLGPYGTTWLDYVVVSPSLSNRDLRPLPYDLSRKFLERCVTDPSYYIDTTNMTDFCREGLFRLTTSFNKGALSCRCNPEGSVNFGCKPYGGQCTCKPNVIGRQCTQCKAGYYGFPRCQKCKCPPNAVCDKVTGECNCPPNVVGENCDRCKPFHFDYSPQGCAFCGCSFSGVKHGNMQCDLVSGDCDCRANIDGRKCHRCQNGYYGYPQCKFCNCYEGGVRPGACDKETALCDCKENVAGRFCDSCKQGYYFLDESNPVGCTKCFCSGKTIMCESAPMRRTNITDHDGWQKVSVRLEDLSLVPMMEEDVEASADETHIVVTQLSYDIVDGGEAIYLRAPDSFSGSRLTSYGGKLRVSVVPQLRGGEEPLEGLPDVILMGEDDTFVHFVDAESVSPSGEMRYEVTLNESSFRTDILKQFPVDRAQFMSLLTNVNVLLIRVAYFKDIDNVAISVTLDDAILAEDVDEVDDRVYTVEECQCPQGYAGMSCESCAAGYFRSGAQCKPCQCYGHSSECDSDTGRCTQCEHNTEGDHCESCMAGYYGDARGRTATDCKVCPCPLAEPENNFALSCEVSNVEMSARCVCTEGYAGLRCEQCDTGYWGEPGKRGGSCRVCECNGNNHQYGEAQCDRTNGTCLSCDDHTAGPHCEICEEWFWGDAIREKNCTDCGCDRNGADRCEKTTGECVCKENVVGELCQECAPDHWGLEGGQGCTPCNCGRGANSSVCDLSTGQCSCKPGVSGIQCDQCAQGFWNLTDNGCQPCNCELAHAKGMSCNVTTGHCTCLPGVIGERCER